jgi:6-pyruvoyltetrahydropterin/6-carboxytetrahydropterin synthase
MISFQSTKIIELGSCAFRQWKAEHSHCKFIHGYRLQAKFWFGCKSLDNKNWVVDFGGLNDLKNILQKQFDHTFCVAGDDPLLSHFQQLHKLGALDLRIMKNGVGIERTAEWCFTAANDYCKNITNGRCWVERVEVWEHEKNSAICTMQRSDINDSQQKYSADQFEFNFNKTETTVQPLEHAPIANTVAAPASEIQKAVESGAAVGNKITTGWGNPFGGTSWGA